MVKIKLEGCIGCCVCLGESPDVFDLGEDGKAYSVFGDEVPAEYFHDLLRAETNCPAHAIKVEK